MGHQEDALKDARLITSAYHYIGLLPQSLRPGFFGLLMLTGAGTLLELLGLGMVIPLLTVLVLDVVPEEYGVIGNIVSRLPMIDHQHAVLFFFVIFVSFFILKAAFSTFTLVQQGRFHFALQRQLAELLMKRTLERDYGFHLIKNSSEIKKDIVVETNLLITYTSIPLVILISELMTVFTVTILLALINSAAALLAIIVPIVMAFLFFITTRKRINEWGQNRHEHERELFKLIDHGLGGIKELKLTGGEPEFLFKFRSQNKAFTDAKRKHFTLAQVPRVMLELLAVVILSGTILFILGKGLSGAEAIPLAGAFVMAAARLIPSANRILTAYQNIKFGASSIHTLRAGIGTKTITRREHPTKTATPLKSKISVQSLSFQYETAEGRTLQDVDLVIPAFIVAGIIGASGSGKTTLIDTIIGLLKPTSGSICIDGHDIQDNLIAWQRQIGYVPQQVFLTDDTLRHNIAYFIPEGEIDEDAVTKAVQSAQLTDFVAHLPDGLDTLVGENGVRLSGGQRQRIGIARALYRNPAVLVLDEATSALDTTTESKVMESIQRMRNERTILIVSHRPSFVQYCDQIFEVADGTVKAR